MKKVLAMSLMVICLVSNIGLEARSNLMDKFKRLWVCSQLGVPPEYNCSPEDVKNSKKFILGLSAAAVTTLLGFMGGIYVYEDRKVKHEAEVEGERQLKNYYLTILQQKIAAKELMIKNALQELPYLSPRDQGYRLQEISKLQEELEAFSSMYHSVQSGEIESKF